ncbi:nitrogen regulation protein NR(II), partial [Vibrio parahaemolyticus]|nr:nitrogen regulation protein NR(II) [Vibrio parahaemolyticus]
DGLAIRYANPAAELLFSQSAKRIIEQSLSQLIQHASLDLALLTQPLQSGQSITDSASLDLALLTQPLQSGQSITDSDVTFVVDGRPLMLEVTVSPITWQKQLMLLVEMRKIDQQRRLSQELNQHAQQQAAKLLVRGLAHEIKNPLGGLRGAAQLLEKMLPEPSLTEYTHIIIEQADRLRALVDRLLGPQKPGKKTQENLHQILEKVRQLVELESQRSIIIERDYDPSLPEILMDTDQIEQAMLNIVSNAAQILSHQEHGKITIRTRTV